MKKRYQVFISSTYTDLIEERKKIQEILLMADCIPAGMEAFVATNDEQFNVIKKVIDLCDYYVLIVGGRYGSVNEKTGLSYTEMEYDYAVSKRIPVLVFCIDGSVELPSEKIDSDEAKAKKLTEFKDKVMKNRLASIWKDLSELAGQAAIAIMKAKEEIERPGWVRADTIGSFDNSELLSQLNGLRIENKQLSEKLSIAEDKLKEYTNLDNTDIAFDEAAIRLESYTLNGGNIYKNTTLKELFGIISLQMLNGSASMSDIENAVATYVGGSKIYKIKDPTIIKTALNQYEALGLIKATFMGFELTELGRKIKNDIMLIRK